MPTAPRNYDRRRGQYFDHASAATSETSNNRRGRGQNNSSAIGTSDDGYPTSNTAASTSNRRHNRDNADHYKTYDRDDEEYSSRDTKLARSGNSVRNEVAEDTNRRRNNNDNYRNKTNSDTYREDSYSSKSGGTYNSYSNRRGGGDNSDNRHTTSDEYSNTNRRGTSAGVNSHRRTDDRSSSKDYANTAISKEWKDHNPNTKDENASYGKATSSKTNHSQNNTTTTRDSGGDRRSFYDKTSQSTRNDYMQRNNDGQQRRMGAGGNDRNGDKSTGGGSRNRETFEEGYHYEMKAAETQQRKLNEAVEEEMAKLKIEREQRAAEEALKAHSRSSSFSLPLNEVDAMFRGQDSDSDEGAHQPNAKKENQQRSRFFDAEPALDVIAPPKSKAVHTLDPKDMLSAAGSIWRTQNERSPSTEPPTKSWDVSELEKQIVGTSNKAPAAAKVLTLAELETQLVVSSLIKEIPVANMIPATTKSQSSKPDSVIAQSPAAIAATPPPTSTNQADPAPKNSPTLVSGKAPPPSYELRPRNSPSLQHGQQGGSVAPLAIPSSAVETAPTASVDPVAPATPLNAAAAASPASNATTGSPVGQQPIARPTATTATTVQSTTAPPYVTYYSPQSQGTSVIQQQVAPAAQAHQQYIVAQTAQGPQYYALPPNSDVGAYIASFAQRGITAHPVQPQQVLQQAAPQQTITQQQLQMLYAQQAHNQQQMVAQQQLQLQQQQQLYLQQQQQAAALVQQQAMAQQQAALAAQRGQAAYYYAQQSQPQVQQQAFQYGTQQPAYRTMTAEEYTRALQFQQQQQAAAAAAAAGRR